MRETLDPDSIMSDATLDGIGTSSRLVIATDEAVTAQRHLEQRLRAELGTNNTDFRALLLIYRLNRRGVPAHPSDLTRGLGISSGTASQVIARLTSVNLLDRTPDPHDARAGRLALSEEAADRLAHSTSALRSDLDQIVAGVSQAEEHLIIRLLDQIRTAFDRHSQR